MGDDEEINLKRESVDVEKDGGKYEKKAKTG